MDYRNEMNPIDTLLLMIPGHSMIELNFSIILCIVLSFFAYWREILDFKGAIAAFFIGIVIAIFTNIYWLITLICFLCVTFIVTRFDFSYKKSHGLAQGKHGERGLRNVMANGTIPILIAVFRYQLGTPLASLLFICSISVAASDSFANEIGVLSNKAYLITDLRKRVKPGTDGGVSRLGQSAALIGAMIPAILGWFLISEFNNNIISINFGSQMTMTSYSLLLPIFIGFIGCQIDSVLGATLQRKGYLSNDNVNFLTIMISVVLAFIIVTVIPF